MTKAKYKKLKVHDTVTLAVRRPDYTYGHNTPDGLCYIPAGAVGWVTALNVPNVFGKGTFTCVDFQDLKALEDCKGRPMRHWSYGNHYRCAATAEDLVRGLV